MMFGRTFLVLCFLALSGSVFSQECDALFTGRVLDASGVPLPGAVVIVSPGQMGAVTDASGNFRLENLCHGDYHVHVRMIGYEEVAFDIHAGDRVIDRTVQMKEAVRELREVVVQHHDETLTEHASVFTIVEGRDLARVTGKSLGESLRAVAGVTTITTGPGISKPVIHGLHSNRILILNHGIRQEGQQWGLEHAPEIDPFIASNLVVIKDASAIKYGAGALGGVVVVNPPALPETGAIGGSLNLLGQTNGRMGIISGMIEGGVGDIHGWGWRIQGTGKRAGDFHTPDYNLTNTGHRELNFSAAAGYHGSSRGFDVYFSRFQTSIGILRGTSVSNVDDLAEAMKRDRPLYTAPFSYTIREPRQEVVHNLFKVNGHILTHSGDWRIQYGFQNNQRKEFDIRMGGLSHIPAIDLLLNTHTLDAEWETHHSDNRTFAAGINLLYQDNDNVPGTQRIPFIPNFNTTSAGGFGVAKLFFNKTTVDLGARLDYRHYDVRGFDYRNTFYNRAFSFLNASATLGATWNADDHNIVSLNLSSAWRPPHVSELFSVGAHQSAASVEYGLLLDPATNEVMEWSNDFQAEQALKAVGTWVRSSPRFRVEVTPYVNYIRNYIHVRPSGVTRSLRGAYPYFRYRQTDALLAGADVASRWQVIPGFSIHPKVSLLWAKDLLSDDVLPMIAANRYEMALRLEQPVEGIFTDLFFEVDVRYTARQNRAPRVVTIEELMSEDTQATDGRAFDFMAAPPDYLLIHTSAGATRRIGDARLDVRVAAENLLDQRYRDYTNRLRYYADETGRNFILSLKISF